MSIKTYKQFLNHVCHSSFFHYSGFSEYKELGKVPPELFNRLFTKLPDEDREILEQYNSESMKQLNRQDEFIYARGLQDGIILSRWLDRVARGEVKNIV